MTITLSSTLDIGNNDVALLTDLSDMIIVICLGAPHGDCLIIISMKDGPVK